MLNKNTGFRTDNIPVDTLSHAAPKKPFYFVNIHCQRNGGMFHFEQDIIHDRDKAIREAEEQDDAYPYMFTLTNLGRIDLRPEFSDEYHQRQAHDAYIDIKIDEAKDLRGMEL